MRQPVSAMRSFFATGGLSDGVMLSTNSYSISLAYVGNRATGCPDAVCAEVSFGLY